MKSIFKIIFLLLTLSEQATYAEESNSEKADLFYNRAQKLYNQEQYEDAIILYKESYFYKPSGDAANNIGSAYSELKSFNKGIEWYKKAYEHGILVSAKNIGLIYDEKFKNYDKAIEWYLKAANKGIRSAAFNLALLYKDIKKDDESAIKWYKEAIELGENDAYDNISLIYHDKKDNVIATAYYLATIDKSYTKKEILDFLRNDWKIDNDTLKKAYELQKTLVPNPYTGGID